MIQRSCSAGFRATKLIDQICNDGVWAPSQPDSSLKQGRLSECDPVCEPRCQNGGICQVGNKCACREGYGGGRCLDRSSKPCSYLPTAVKNAHISYK